MFLSQSSEPYTWKSGDADVVNAPLDIKNFPVVESILNKIKKKLGCSVNSVLVSRMNSGISSIRYHDDDEDSMDPRQPICVVSLGAKRTVQFCAKNQADYRETLLSISPDDRSMYVMKAGCQTHFLHRVRKNGRVKQPRYTLSFRCFIPKSERKTVGQLTPSPVKNLIAKFDSPDEVFKTPGPTPIEMDSGNKSTSPEITSTPWHSSVADLSLEKASAGYSPYPSHDTLPSQQLSSEAERYCVIFGTSITEGVDGAQMSRGSRRVINHSVNGAKIGDIREEIRDFCIDNPGATKKADKVIICVGTNDIKHFDSFNYDMVKRFRKPLTHLIRQAKFVFPNAQIILKSVLPIQVRFKYTPKSVQEFNYLLLELCGEFGCIFFDCFAEFLDCYGVDYNGCLYRDWLHLNDEGLKVLCRALKFVIYQDIFNPYMRTSNCHQYYY